jgi:mRNA interferase RelE/StbE
MAWTLEFTASALKDLDKLDPVVRERILNYLATRLARQDNPRNLGKALQGKKYENQWRYRVGDYRIIAEIKENVVTILVVEIGHRRDIYR